MLETQILEYIRMNHVHGYIEKKKKQTKTHQSDLLSSLGLFAENVRLLNVFVKKKKYKHNIPRNK